MWDDFVGNSKCSLPNPQPSIATLNHALSSSDHDPALWIHKPGGRDCKTCCKPPISLNRAGNNGQLPYLHMYLAATATGISYPPMAYPEKNWLSIWQRFPCGCSPRPCFDFNNGGLRRPGTSGRGRSGLDFQAWPSICENDENRIMVKVQ